MMTIMKKYINLFLGVNFFSLLIFSSCSKKEQELSDKLKGKWTVSELRFNEDSIYSFAEGVHSIEFYGGKKAYTSTFLGVYRIDYVDQILKDVADTFRYDIKENQLNITNIDNASNTSKTFKLIRYRYKIETLNNTELYLNRTPFDTTTAYLKAFK